MELRLSEALGNELPEISRAINLKEILAATWGRNASVLVGQRFPGGLLWDFYTNSSCLWSNCSPWQKYSKGLIYSVCVPAGLRSQRGSAGEASAEDHLTHLEWEGGV